MISRQNLMRWVRMLFVFGYVSTMLVFAYAVPAHLGDPSWPPHARNHVLQALIWIEGFCLSGAVIALIPLKKNEPWAWWTTLLIGAVIYGGYFLAIPITGGGAPGILDDVVFGFLGLVHIVALALSWNALKTPGALRP